MISVSNTLNVFIAQKALGPLAGDFVDRVDEQDAFLYGFGFCVRQMTTQASIGEL